jgi:hypothetical protein
VIYARAVNSWLLDVSDISELYICVSELGAQQDVIGLLGSQNGLTPFWAHITIECRAHWTSNNLGISSNASNELLKCEIIGILVPHVPSIRSFTVVCTLERLLPLLCIPHLGFAKMQDIPSNLKHCSTVSADSSHHSSTSESCVIQILGPAEDHSNKQHAQRPTKLSQPPQAVTRTGSASAVTLLMRLCSKLTTTAECRICLSAGSAEQELIQPCACAGTMGYAHGACLSTWVQEKGSLTCELCKQQYQEQYVQALDLTAAAEKAGNKASLATAADMVNSCQSWLRFWLL